MANTRNNHFVSSFILSILLFSSLSAACTATPTPCKFPPANPFCPHDALKFGACANVLGSTGTSIGSPPSGSHCCTLLSGLVDAEAAACLCTAIKETVLGAITTEWSVAVGFVVSSCNKQIPDGFKCV